MIYRDVYIFKVVPFDPIVITAGTTELGIEFNFRDLDINGKTIRAFCKNSTGIASSKPVDVEYVYEENKMRFYPETGFFVEGDCEMMLEINDGEKYAYSFLMPVKCLHNIFNDSETEVADIVNAMQRTMNAMNVVQSTVELVEQHGSEIANAAAYAAQTAANKTEVENIKSELQRAVEDANKVAKVGDGDISSYADGTLTGIARVLFPDHDNWNDGQNNTIDDLNDVTVQGIVQVRGSGTLHCPTNSWGHCITLIRQGSATTYKRQIFICITTNMIYTRFLSNTSWSEWQELAFAS